ncbi:uncharacterized protein METZ01_LOCUS245019, partial [marine metagenome]
SHDRSKLTGFNAQKMSLFQTTSRLNLKSKT